MMETEITRGIFISEDEVVFKFSCSSGPGGQNVNKVNTRATLYFDVEACSDLSNWQKRRILERLATRADKHGVLRVVCQKHRTQKANRRQAFERFGQLLAEALKRRRPRKKTKIPRYAVEKRLAEKRRRSELKKQRAKVN